MSCVAFFGGGRQKTRETVSILPHFFGHCVSVSPQPPPGVNDFVILAMKSSELKNRVLKKNSWRRQGETLSRRMVLHNSGAARGKRKGTSRSLKKWSSDSVMKKCVALWVVLSCVGHVVRAERTPSPKQEQDILILDALGKRQQFGSNLDYGSNSIMELLGRSMIRFSSLNHSKIIRRHSRQN